MAANHLNFGHNPIKTSKNKIYYHPHKTIGVSFWAFLLSIFIYISIFYTFNLSLSTLFNTTKFWFFISNTLILIIAADFGAFSLSRKGDSYEIHYSNIYEKRIPREDMKELVQESEFRKNKLASVDQENYEENGIIMVEDCSKNIMVQSQQILKSGEENVDENGIEVEDCSKDINTCEDEKKIVVEEAQILEKEGNVEENDKFSGMSSEELNKRVEEFIQEFKRQCRVQPVGGKINK